MITEFLIPCTAPASPLDSLLFSHSWLWLRLMMTCLLLMMLPLIATTCQTGAWWHCDNVDRLRWLHCIVHCVRILHKWSIIVAIGINNSWLTRGHNLIGGNRGWRWRWSYWVHDWCGCTTVAGTTVAAGGITTWTAGCWHIGAGTCWAATAWRTAWRAARIWGGWAKEAEVTVGAGDAIIAVVAHGWRVHLKKKNQILGLFDFLRSFGGTF